MNFKSILNLALYIYMIWHEGFNFLRLQVAEGQVFNDKVYFSFIVPPKVVSKHSSVMFSSQVLKQLNISLQNFLTKSLQQIL